MANCRGCNSYEGLCEQSRQLRQVRATLQIERDQCSYVRYQYESEIDQLRTKFKVCEDEKYRLEVALDECKYESQQQQQKYQREVHHLEDTYNDMFASKQAKILHQEREIMRLFNLKEQNETLEATQSSYRENLNQFQQENHKMFELQSKLKETQQLLKNSETQVESRSMEVNILDTNIEKAKSTGQWSEERNMLRHKLRESENELKQTKSERDRNMLARRELERRLVTKESKITILEKRNSPNILSYTIYHIDRELRDLKLKRCPSVRTYHQEDTLRRDLVEKDDQIRYLRNKLEEDSAKFKATEKRLSDIIATRECHQLRPDLEHTNEQMVTTLKQKVRHLVFELEKRDKNLTDLKEILDNTKMKSVRDMDLIGDKRKTEDKLSEQRNQLQNAESKLKDTRAQLNEATSERDIERQTRQHSERKTEAYKTKINEIEQLRESTERLHTQKMQNLQREVERRDIKLKDYEEILEKRMVEATKKTEVTTDLKKKNEQLSEQGDRLQQALTKLRESDAKLNEAVSERDLERKSRQELERKMNANHARIKELEQINDKQVTKQNEIIQTLQRDVESRDLKLKGLEEQQDNRIVGLMKEREVTTDLETRDVHLSELRHQLHLAETRLKESEAKLGRAISERDFERTTREQIEMKTREDHVTVNKLEQEHDRIVTPLKQRIQYLEGEAKRRDLKLKGLEDTLDSRKVEGGTVKGLMKELENKEDLLSEQKNQLQRALTKLKETECKLKETTSERDDERQTRQHLERGANENRTRFKDLEQRKNEEVTAQKHRIQHLEREFELRDLKIKDLEEISDKTKAEVNRGNELGNALREKEKQLEKLKDQLNQISVKLKETEAELEETKTRLSKAMGDKLTDNNPNIADLSDKNRPVKLAERYAEMYDNQWTDAFDVVGKYFDREQQTIEALLAMLQDVMVFCNESGSKQMKDLQSVLGFSNIHRGVVSADVRKNLKDCRKAASSVAIENLYETYMSQLKRSTSQILVRALEVRPYVKESLEICWLMVIQDPPVVFAPVAKPGSELNTDVFKPYTSSGTHVEYTVWPALLLHEGGPVLAKGVAQGYGKKSK